MTTASFAFTGAVQSWTAPYYAAVTATLNGAGVGYAGGKTTLTFIANAGDVLNIYVGGQPSGTTGGWNGGGAGGTAQNANGSGGGGATDIRLNGTALSNRIAVAGGASNGGVGGGVGGGLSGGNGNTSGGSSPGYGGTQTYGGSGGTSPSPVPDSGSSGTLGAGGAGASTGFTNTYGGSGGGGGYYGGGGAGCGTGATSGSGPGGGSGYTAPSINGAAPTGASTTAGAGSTGSGSVTLVYAPASSAPAAPTPVSPAAGATLDVSAGVTFTSTYNSTDTGNQDAYALRVKQSGASTYSYWNASSGALQSTVVWNSVVTTPGNQWSVTLPGTALTNGFTYNWAEASQEVYSSLQGPFATDSTFNAQTNPALTVTAPSGSATTSDAMCEWTATPAQGAQQTAYRMVLYTAAQYGAGGFAPGTSTSTWDSGVVASGAQLAPIGYTLVNGVAYRIYVQVTETGGETSQWEYSAFAVTFDVPAAPTLTVSPSTTVGGLPAVGITVATHDNILSTVDASFETGVGSWTSANAVNATTAQESTVAEDGSFALKVTATAAGDMSASSYRYVVTAGGTYSATASLRAATAARAASVSIRWFDASGAALTVTSGSSLTDSTTAWTECTVTGVAPPTAATAALKVYVAGPAASEVHYVDETGIFPGTVTTWTRGGLAGVQQVTLLRDDGLYVRGASPANPLNMPVSQSFVLYDAEVVPTVPHTYTAVSSVVLDSTTTIASATSAATTPVTLTTVGWWEFDPTDLTTAVSAQVTEYNPQITEQSAAHVVLGQTTYNIIAGSMGGVDGTATFETFDTPTYLGLSRLLTSQKTVFISDPFGDNQGVTYVRFGPQTGGMSSGNGNKTKDSSLHPSTTAAPHHTTQITWVAAPRPVV